MSVLVLDDTRPVARKEHRCDVCLGTIATGDTYHRQRNIGDDGPYVFKAHALCDAAYFKASRDLDLYDDESPDISDEVMPLVAAFFAALTFPVSLHTKEQET